MKIKRLYEQQYFSQSFSGDGFNSSNGVFKVSYKPYDDLSVSRGQDVVPSHYMKGEDFQMGDMVRGQIKRSEKFVTGKIVGSYRNDGATEITFKVKSDKTNTVYDVVTSSMEMVKNTGFVSPMRHNLQGGERMAMNMKYNSGNLIWGTLESQEVLEDTLLTNNGQRATRKGILDNTLNLEVVVDGEEYEAHKENFQKLGIAYLDPATRTIFIDGANQDFGKLTPDHMVTIEAHELAHTLMGDKYKDNVEKLCDLVAARILRNKGYNSPYKIIVSNFIGRHKCSYGECLDDLGSELDIIVK